MFIKKGEFFEGFVTFFACVTILSKIQYYPKDQTLIILSKVRSSQGNLITVRQTTQNNVSILFRWAPSKNASIRPSMYQKT